MPTSTRIRTRAARIGTTGAVAAVVGVATFACAFAQSATPEPPRYGPGPDDPVEASLVADVASIQPGKPFRIAVRFVMTPGWHVNWINPGDAGLAPSIGWRLPKGFKAGLVEWPLPSRFVTGPLVIFGYDGEVLLSADVMVPAGLEVGTAVDLAADVSWLACSETCVPGTAKVSLRLPVEASTRADPQWGPKVESARARCPMPPGAWNVDARVGDSGTLFLDLQTAADASPTLEDVFFFPLDQGLIENAAAQPLATMEGPYGRVAYQLRVERARIGTELPARLMGILVCKSGWAAGAGPQAMTVDVPLGY